jgi:hypothetical protein
MFSAGFGSGEQIQEEPTPELPDPCKVMPAPEYDPARSFFPNSSRPDFTKPALRPKSKKNKKR